MGDSLVVQTEKNPPAKWETWVRSLGWEDPLEKEMVTYSSTLAGKSPGQRKLAGYSPWGHKETKLSNSTSRNVLMLRRNRVVLGWHLR